LVSDTTGLTTPGARRPAGSMVRRSKTKGAAAKPSDTKGAGLPAGAAKTKKKKKKKQKGPVASRAARLALGAKIRHKRFVDQTYQDHKLHLARLATAFQEDDMGHLVDDDGKIDIEAMTSDDILAALCWFEDSKNGGLCSYSVLSKFRSALKHAAKRDKVKFGDGVMEAMNEFLKGISKTDAADRATGRRRSTIGKVAMPHELHVTHWWCPMCASDEICIVSEQLFLTIIPT